MLVTSQSGGACSQAKLMKEKEEKVGGLFLEIGRGLASGEERFRLIEMHCG